MAAAAAGVCGGGDTQALIFTEHATALADVEIVMIVIYVLGNVCCLMALYFQFGILIANLWRGNIQDGIKNMSLWGWLCCRETNLNRKSWTHYAITPHKHEKFISQFGKPEDDPEYITDLAASSEAEAIQKWVSRVNRGDPNPNWLVPKPGPNDRVEEWIDPWGWTPQRVVPAVGGPPPGWRGIFWGGYQPQYDGAVLSIELSEEYDEVNTGL